MKFLLFLLGVIFFFIFFLFSKIQEVEGYFITSIFLQANIYVAIALILIFFLSFTGKKSQDKQQEEYQQEKIAIVSKDELIIFIKEFFSRYIYYIALSIFYVAIYFIFHPLYPELNPDFFLLILNLLVLFLYFIEHKFEPFQDFVRVNLILGSLYYIGKHMLYIGGWYENISTIDFINIVFLCTFYIASFYSSRGLAYKSLISHTFIAFIFLEIVVLYNFFFKGGILSFGVISGCIGFFLLFFTDLTHTYSTIKKAFIREWGVIFLGIFTLVSLFFLSLDNIWIYILIVLLLASSYILRLFHERFSNYFALIISSVGLSGALYGVYNFSFFFDFNLRYIYIFFFLLAGFFIVFDMSRKKRHIYDEYFYRMYSLLVNIIGVFCFFFFTDISILSVGIILLIESMYLFFSYYSFSKISSRG